jgi:peptidyl-dipeptidase A
VPLALAAVLVVSFLPAVRADSAMTERARHFIKNHESQVRPLEVAANLAWWNANITGKKEDFAQKEEAQNRLDEALANHTAFEEVKHLKNHAKEIDDPITARCIQVIYLAYLEKQVKPALLKKITAKANAVEQAFNVFRAEVDGKKITDNQVREILKKSNDSARRRKVWEASKAVGSLLRADLRELVKLRNESARNLGFKNYHDLQLYLNEQTPEQILKLFDQLDELTREPFRKAKAEIDEKLAARYGVKKEELMPWHYHDPFFQEPPAVFGASLDEPFAHADIEDISRRFYGGIGLPIDDVLKRSDLNPKPGKSQHAFCTDIDREGDVRVLANITKNESWMSTMLHELGHSVYSSKNIPRSLPYTLRMEAHILTTEGVAMMFQRWSRYRPWLEAMGLKVKDPQAFDETAAKMQRNELLIFSRWCQVMLRFEKSMYEDPDQDLNKLWWDLVERYQELKRPAGRDLPDYASKIHIVSAPVYYHNYMMGQLFASQVHHAMCREVLHGANPRTALYVGNKAVGAFMKKKVFDPGRTKPWNALTEYATGKPLNAEAFAEDFKGK